MQEKAHLQPVHAVPIDRGTVDQQLQALGESARWNHRELRDLPVVLRGGEHILAISRGKLGRGRWLRRKWLIVVTDTRLLCLRSAGSTSWRQLELEAGQITRVSLRIGPFAGKVLIGAGGRKYRILVPRADAYKLASALSSIGRSEQDVASGFTPARLVNRVIDHVLALPAAVLNPNPPDAHPASASPASARDPRIELLEEQVQELQRQVDFLEQLLRQRQGAGPSLPPT